MHSVNQIMGGPAYSPVFGACVEGERMIVALMRYPAGKRSDAHYVPANKVHKAANHGKKDVVFFTCKDASHGLHGNKAGI